MPEPALLLVVEDNEPARVRLAALLERAGYRVALAANGKEALDRLGQEPRPDLVLLDMLMPVLDGWHFLERLRGREQRPPVPIIVTTATVLSREWAEAHGCQGFVPKPIDPDALLREIRRCMPEAPPAS